MAAPLWLVLVALASGTAPGRNDSTVASPDEPAEVRAVRVATTIVVDGVLDEAAWAEAEPVERFVQREPHEGEAASERTTVRVLYDDRALYVGARLYDRAPDSVLALLARRDRDVTADRFTVFLDPYHDGRSGFFFGVNAAGTLYDGTLYNDDWDDWTWDGVWEGRVARDSLGWSVEMRIPYSQLRFERRDRHVWGINFRRDVGRRNERSYLVYTPRNGSGFVSRFARLVGIDGLTPPPRLEVLPYVTTKAEYVRHDAGDPFNDGSRLGTGVGADFKLGLGSNLTLDATVNPDFGQVEVDPAVVNLSDVEVFYEERRPFFVEGANIFNFGQGGANSFWGFNWGNPDFLYTRRIGRPPQGTVPDADFSDVPDGTHIVGALKLTGKVGEWSLGGLGALTRRERATLATGGSRWRAEVEPRTWYGVARLQRELAGGRHGVGLITTGVARAFDGGDLRDELASSALVVGVDGWTTLDANRTWVLTGWAGSSVVRGTPERMIALQESSVHYFQRPDASHVSVDSLATSLTGFAGRIAVNKQKGNWLFNSAFGLIDPGFEVNDLGFASRSDQLNGHVMVGYRQMQPGRVFRNWRVNGAVFQSRDFGGTVTWSGLYATTQLELKNFSILRSFVAYNPRTWNNRRTRGGPLMTNPAGVEWDVTADSDRRRAWVLGISVGGGHYGLGSDEWWRIGPRIEWKPTGRLSVSLEPAYERTRTAAQYVDTFDDGLAAATFGRRYVFADLDQTTLSASLRVNWIFSPRLSLEVFAQPLVSSGDYTGFKELARPRSFDFVRYGEPVYSADRAEVTVDPDGAGPAAPVTFDNPTFSLASLRGNAVLRWEYLPGSTLFLVWTQHRSAEDYDGAFRLGRSVNRLLDAAADHVVMVKISYWWSP